MNLKFKEARSSARFGVRRDWTREIGGALLFSTLKAA
jgi:hypothetical protein